MVKHTMHFQIDGETLDLQLHYEKATSDEFPKAIRFNRLDFELAKQSFIVHSELITNNSVLHIHAYYETTLNKLAEVILPP